MNSIFDFETAKQRIAERNCIRRNWRARKALAARAARIEAEKP